MLSSYFYVSELAFEDLPKTYIFLISHRSTALYWTLVAFSVSCSFTRSVGLLSGGSAYRKASVYTQNDINTE
jgi:hypothetical protein